MQIWYGVPSDASEALEGAMRDAFPNHFKTAPDLLYQLVTMLSPAQLKARNVPVYRVVHRQGSFVITFPNAYHSGFNSGTQSIYPFYVRCLLDRSTVTLRNALTF